ncbi:MAG: NUDIX domain-containing protein [Proteobacteria bacterium]|nr:NUDIX domain-containing protein [Pseudomonadota bacterium]MBU1390113.1 NUDIX domain-containing protein [Pseudomonadota bacterium]MBU1544936.1 NUDIX domain-containing protein [Pseudomonadota bacterium]MBU2482272.1 NUDIX domain-containing protein [Pseudomonadota bacterium]
MNIRANPNQQKFSYCPSCGKKDLNPASDKSFVCKSCGFCFYINCAAAAMALILDDQGRLLVTVRKKDPSKGALDLPGGFAEPGEGIFQSLIREVKEELNLDITQLSFLCSFPNTYVYKSVTYPITDMAFFCTVKNFDSITAKDDVADFKFVFLEDVNTDAFAFSSTKNVIEYFKEIKKGL